MNVDCRTFALSLSAGKLAAAPLRARDGRAAPRGTICRPQWLIWAAMIILAALAQPIFLQAAEPAAEAVSEPSPAATDTAQAADDPAVKQAGDALARRWRYPWYDRQADRLQPTAIRKPAEPPPEIIWTILRWLSWAVLALIVGVIVWLIVSAVRSGGWGSASVPTVDLVQRRVNHVEALPFLAKRSLDNLREQAAAAYAAGNYAEAIILLFSYQLVELDRRSLIRLAAGKTNRQYLRELAGRPQLRALLEQTMVLFEEVYFGGRLLSRERFESNWQRLGEFDAWLDHSSTETAALANLPLAAAPGV